MKADDKPKTVRISAAQPGSQIEKSRFQPEEKVPENGYPENLLGKPNYSFKEKQYDPEKEKKMEKFTTR